MHSVRYVLLALFTFAPTLALAQFPDSVAVEVEGAGYPSYGAGFGTSFCAIEGRVIGPLPVIVAEPYVACERSVGRLDNADEVEGNIVLIGRGECRFDLKVTTASEAGAAAVIVVNAFVDDPNAILRMGGDCAPEVCTAPAVGVSINTGNEILDAEPGAEATLRLIDDLPTCGDLPPPPPLEPLDTGTVQTTLFADGFIGHAPNFVSGPGFTFGDTDGLFASIVLVGVDGEVMSNPYNGRSEFLPVENTYRLLDPDEVPAPFDSGLQAVFTSALGFTVTLTGYADVDPPNQEFIAFELAAQNTSVADIEEVYLGLFADFDTGSAHTDDAGGVIADLNLVYVFDPVEAFPYFGVTAIGDPGSLSGYSADATVGTDAQLWEALTTANEPGTEPAERAAVVGVGPFDIPEGATQHARFAFVAGSDLADLIANAAAAQFPIVTSAEATPVGTFALGAAYPNPFSDRATIGFTLPTAQAVRLAVYDVLGREVAVLVDGARPAGEQAVAFDAAGLPSGVYLYRLEATDPACGAGGTVLTQRLTLVR